MSKKIPMFSFLFLLLTVVGCSGTTQPDKQTDHELTIYTSIYPIQYITEQIAGKQAVVKTVYPPGVDAHSYEPTTKEILDIANADSFIFLGAGMEGFAEAAAESLKTHDVLFIELGKHDTLFEHQHEHEDDGHDHGGRDPHIWLDPLRMIDMAHIIKQELVNLAPEFQDQFAANYEKLKKDLIALDQEFIDTLKEKAQKDIIVSHAAYGYWEDRYGIKQLSISGLMAGNEPSQKELTHIVEQAKDKHLKYVIFEQNGSDRVSKIIQEHIGAEALYIHNLEVLTEDDLAKQADYLTLMRLNLSVLDQATN